MSEHFPPEAAPPEDDLGPPAAEQSEAAEPREHRTRSGWIAPAWFFFGIIVGIASFAAYNALIAKPSTTAQVESVDSTVVMREAARDGVLEAIATLQASNGQPAAQQQQPQGPQEVASNAFVVRDANRQGNANATVTIYEFSDFQ